VTDRAAVGPAESRLLRLPSAVAVSIVVAVLSIASASPLHAQELAPGRAPENLKDLSAGRTVNSITYWRGLYEVSLGDGSIRRFKEYDLAFKTDASPSGPPAAKPALVPTGRVGDRAFVVFADLDELRRMPKASCPRMAP